jgi:hypothetical protein
MSSDDWRSPGHYEHLLSLDAPGFAWEYLRRNPDFAREHAMLQRTSRRHCLNANALEAFSQRWGVRFCEYQRYRKLQICYLDSPCPAECDRPNCSTARSRQP